MGRINLFEIPDNISLNYKNQLELEAFRIEENKLLFKNLFKDNTFSKKAKTIFSIIRKRIMSLSRDIRRNSPFIIKKSETKFNPLLLYICIISNRILMNSKFLLIIIALVVYTQLYLVEKEVIFVIYSDNGYFFLLLGILISISNYIYYCFYKISCFNHILYASLIMITVLNFMYYFFTNTSKDFPVDLSKYSFSTIGIPHIRKNNAFMNVIIDFIYIILIGIFFYVNLLIIKLSKTLYRCTFFGFNSIIYLASIVLGEFIGHQIKNYFFLIGSLNIIGIFAFSFLGNFDKITNLVNDLKKGIYQDINLKLD